MRRVIHGYMGFAIGFLFVGSNYYLLPLILLFGWLGGWLPDFDLKYRHRKALHNIFSLITFTSIFYALSYIAHRELGLLPDNSSLHISYAFATAYLLHLLFDALTVRGIYPLYPLSNYRFRIARLKSDGVFINLLGFMISSAIIVYWVMEYMKPIFYLKILNT